MAEPNPLVARTLTKRVVGQASIGAPLAAVAAWAWGILMPDYPMPAEVAAAVGGLLGPVVSWVVSWVPSPEQN